MPVGLNHAKRCHFIRRGIGAEQALQALSLYEAGSDPAKRLDAEDALRIARGEGNLLVLAETGDDLGVGVNHVAV